MGERQRWHAGLGSPGDGGGGTLSTMTWRKVFNGTKVPAARPEAARFTNTNDGSAPYVLFAMCNSAQTGTCVHITVTVPFAGCGSASCQSVRFSKARPSIPKSLRR
jgi:hypothetical protein